jgi:hypothetical protein
MICKSIAVVTIAKSHCHSRRKPWDPYAIGQHTKVTCMCDRAARCAVRDALANRSSAFLTRLGRPLPSLCCPDAAATELAGNGVQAHPLLTHALDQRPDLPSEGVGGCLSGPGGMICFRLEPW